LTFPTREQILDRLLTYQGAPYVWKGKGLHLWTPAGLALHSFGEPVFDCSGLMGVAILEAGGPDWRATKSADAYRTSLPFAESWEFGALRIYGDGQKANHVSFVVRPGYVLEAAGGDSTTTSPAEARKRGRARVAVNRDRRSDFMCAVRLPFNP